MRAGRLSDEKAEEKSGESLPTGTNHYRAFVGPGKKYDLVAAMQFNLLTLLGLRENHTLLDIGCGSLRGGRLFIPYLLPGNYHGIEPEEWLVYEGIKNEIGRDLIDLKKPSFSHDGDFTLTTFGREFDFLLAQSIFSHASGAQIARCLSEAAKVMTPTSIFAATYVRGDVNYTGDEWAYPECVTYTPHYMQSLAGERDLACVPLSWPHPNNQSWVVFTHRQNAKKIPALGDPIDMGKRLRKLEKYIYVKARTKISAVLRKRKTRA